MRPPQRLSDTAPLPPPRATVGIERSLPAYEVLKVRILMKVQDRLDPGKSRRMPPALFQQTARAQVEQVVETDAARLSRAERDRLIDEVFREAFGFGPLEELFADTTVLEVLVLGPQVVVVRRESGWMPTHVRFRDAEQLQDILDRAVGSGEPLAAGLGFSAIDTRLPNGFRLVAIMPPEVLDQSTYAIFVRTQPGTGVFPVLQPGAGNQPGSRTPAPSLPAAPPGTGVYPSAISPNKSTNGHAAAVAPVVGQATSSPAPGEQQLARYRARIIERIITKLASLGVYDVSRLDVNELRRVIAAYVEEYFRTEKIYLSESDQGRLTLEILTTMKP